MPDNKNGKRKLIGIIALVLLLLVGGGTYAIGTLSGRDEAASSGLENEQDIKILDLDEIADSKFKRSKGIGNVDSSEDINEYDQED